ncbi:MAG TPA: hypothetical protein VJ833_00110 [Rhodanobacteraceae bacterium]|nr:hypothetical protein [Rhodanobacteraceae bacterium]
MDWDASPGNGRRAGVTGGRRRDIVSPAALKADWIFNLACCASSRHDQRDPQKTIRTCTCTGGALNMLHEAYAGGARIFQASSPMVS